MSAFGFTLTLSPLKKKRAISEEEAQEVGSEIDSIITEFLEEKLTNEAEAELLEDIDVVSGVLVELDYEALRKSELGFLFKDHWYGGAVAAEHWYRVAITQCSEAINQSLEAVGLCIKDQHLSSFKKWKITNPLVLIDDRMFALDNNGEPIVAEGESVSGTDSQKKQWREIARAKKCQCQLCAELA